MANDLTKEALEGYGAKGLGEAPYYWSSDSWLAWNAGKALDARGSTAPAKVRKSRGYSLRIVTSGQGEFTFTASGKDLADFRLVREG